jgi:hypothetical protein
MTDKSSGESFCEREVDYYLSRAAVDGWMLFFAVSATVFSYQCVTNHRALILNGIIFLPPFAATLFYGFVAGVSLGCIGLGAAVWFHRKRITFWKTGILIPRSHWSRRRKFVSYADLREVRLGTRRSAITGATLLYVQHKHGVEVLSAAMFSSETAFDEFCELLRNKGDKSNY